MIIFDVDKSNKWLLLVNYDDELEKKQLEISLTRKIHNYFFHPLVRKGVWNGSISFIYKRGGIWKVPVGLWNEIYKIGDNFDLDIKINGIEKIIDINFSLNEFKNWCNNFFKDGIGGDPNKKIRDYQIEAAWNIIRYKRSILEIATSSGKTLIAFIVLLYLRIVYKIKNFLIIVPNTNLVIQTTDEFINYGINKLDDFKITQIYEGRKKEVDKGVIIGTYQSLIKMNKSFFEKIETVFVDECHQTQSYSIKKILSKCENSIWRFGLSGSISKKNSAEYFTIQQYLGPLVMEISPKYLFDNKYATPVFVKVIIIDWLDSDTKEKLYILKKNKTQFDGNKLFNLEKKVVINSDKRLNFIVDVILKTTKNSLILFHSVGEGYGKKIYNAIKEKTNQKEVYYIDGNTEPEKREIFIKRMEEGNNKLLIASYGTLSTGINIKNLHNIFLTESYKSEILIKQSFGRGMRLFNGKEKVTVIDFVDDFTWNKKENYLIKHLKERIKIYDKENFNYKIYKVKL